MKKKSKTIKKHPAPQTCPKCGAKGAIRRRQRTAYVDDKMNFSVFCDICQKEESEYWDERWAEYYSGLL